MQYLSLYFPPALMCPSTKEEEDKEKKKEGGKEAPAGLSVRLLIVHLRIHIMQTSHNLRIHPFVNLLLTHRIKSFPHKV